MEDVFFYICFKILHSASYNKLLTSERRDSHEQENTVEDRHGEESEDGGHEDAEASEDGDHEGGQPLLPYPQELRLLSWDRSRALLRNGIKQGDQINMDVFFWYLAESDLSSVRVYCIVHWTSQLHCKNSFKKLSNAREFS